MKAGDRFLVDSVILIDHLNGRPEGTDFLASISGRAVISPITRAEVLTGYDARTLRAPRRFLDRFSLVPIDAAVADLAAALRRRYRWKLPDAFQAAIAQRNRLVFATRNTKDFPPRRHRFVHVPYELQSV